MCAEGQARVLAETLSSGGSSATSAAVERARVIWNPRLWTVYKRCPTLSFRSTDAPMCERFNLLSHALIGRCVDFRVAVAQPYELPRSPSSLQT
jgi:hypothetical protein